MFSAIPNVAILQNRGAAAPRSRTLDFSDPLPRPYRATGPSDGLVEILSERFRSAPRTG